MKFLKVKLLTGKYIEKRKIYTKDSEPFYVTEDFYIANRKRFKVIEEMPQDVIEKKIKEYTQSEKTEDDLPSDLKPPRELNADFLKHKKSGGEFPFKYSRRGNMYYVSTGAKIRGKYNAQEAQEIIDEYNSKN